MRRNPVPRGPKPEYRWALMLGRKILWWSLARGESERSLRYDGLHRWNNGNVKFWNELLRTGLKVVPLRRSRNETERSMNE